MRTIRQLSVILFFFCQIYQPIRCEVFEITNQNGGHLNPVNYFYWLQEDTTSLRVHDIITPAYQGVFKKNDADNINFGFSKTGIWLRFSVKNLSDHNNFVIEINNPDLNYVSFYEVDKGSITDSIITGELYKFNCRRSNHRNFVFNTRISKDQSKTYYFYIYNSGDALSVPVSIKPQAVFLYQENLHLLVLGLFYGLALFIVVFNLYLFFSLKDTIYIYYSLYVFFYFLFIFNIDGLSFQYLWPKSPYWSNQSSFVFPTLGILFGLKFVQTFLSDSTSNKNVNHVFNILKVLTIVFFVFSFFKTLLIYSVLGLLFTYSISVVIIVVLSYLALNRNYLPNHYFLAAFVFLLLGMICYALRELGILPYNYFTKNAVRIGALFESIILAIAVLERFRIQQENAKNTIEESYGKIELQNKELEIINAELEKLSIVASETNNSVAIYDHNGRIEWCNTYFEIFYRTNLNTLIKNKKDTIEHIILNEKINDLLNTCLATKTPVTFETQVRSEGGDEIWAQTTLTPLIRRDKVHKLIAIDSDITKLKQYERNLELAKEKAVESDRLKTVFLGNMSHEIRTPLNGIMGFSELLSNTVVSEEKKKKFLEMITSNGEQLLRIIDDIIDISLIESNQMRIDPVSFNLDDLLKGMIDFFEVFKNTINKSHISLILENKIRPDENIIVADPVRLKQVLSNLLRNGLKFTKEGYVKLKCSKQESNLNFCVEDSGIGIDQEMKNIIFERFRQADENMSREYGGTGLGLSISKGIVGKMKGEIWVDTSHIQGLRICFYIPLTESAKGNNIKGDASRQQSVPEIKLN